MIYIIIVIIVFVVVFFKPKVTYYTYNTLGGCVVATSNLAPDQLYSSGINREVFERNNTTTNSINHT